VFGRNLFGLEGGHDNFIQGMIVVDDFIGSIGANKKQLLERVVGQPSIVPFRCTQSTQGNQVANTREGRGRARERKLEWPFDSVQHN